MTRKGCTLRGNGQKAVLPELESTLLVAAAGQVKESKASGRRFGGSRVLAVGAACLAFAGTAVAASEIWNPGIGSETLSGPASVSSSPVPAEITNALGVLRREPAAADRGPAVEATLRKVASGDGVRPESARYLGSESNGQAIVLFSAENVPAEGLCLAQPLGAGPASDCYSLSEILAGEARITFGDASTDQYAVVGIVPDGVASVTLEFGSADRTVPVEDNYFLAPLSGSQIANGEFAVQSAVWLDADGQVVPQG